MLPSGKERADRLGGFSGELLLLSETNLEKIDNTITKESRRW